MNATELVKGVDFDLVAGNIQCIADRDGATVHRVNVRNCRYGVLAHSESDAIEAAREQYNEDHPPEFHIEIP